MGERAAFALFTDVIAPNCQAVDHERFLAFVSHSPAYASSLFDMALSASSIFGTSWLEASGATTAENLALRWLADVAGMPAESGGTFLSGATVANLNALAAARATWRHRHPDETGRLAVAMTAEAHSSARMVARCLDFEIVDVPMDAQGRLTGPNLAAALDSSTMPVCAAIATAGITNVGLIDDLASIATVCRERDVWFHVDAAYGGAAMVVPEKRALFAGIEHADSLVVDPHKWLFTPLDCSALIYREPALARAAFTQHADYLAAFQEVGEWNPGDFAMHLTRRARGLPFWFMLATYGTDTVVDSVRRSLDLATATAREIERRPNLQLSMEPVLSVVVFTVVGWDRGDYQRWSDRLLADGTAFILPTMLNGEPAMRFCFVNPRTTIEDVRLILDTIVPGAQSS
jgi:glutamate/tyrosine decarboxylase-like PLP-dependent enzyme